MQHKLKVAALAASTLGLVTLTAWGIHARTETEEKTLTPQEYVQEQIRACAALESALRISLEEAESARTMEYIARIEKGAQSQ